MRSRLAMYLAVLTMVCVSVGIRAQEPEVTVGEVSLPERVWGKQTLPLEVTNNTDWLKFLVVEADVRFEDSYVNPHRVTQSSFVLEPGVKRTIDSQLEIPPNYGKLKVWLRIYDVVDTLDDMSLGTQVFEQPFQVRFPAPDAVVPYFQDPISLPPLVGNHGAFDNEFERLLLVMTQEGKTLDEIAAMCKADPEFVTATADDLVAMNYLKLVDSAYRPAIPVITQAYAEQGRELVDRFSEKLAEQLTTNLAERRRIIDSLVAAGVYTADSTNFFEGGTLLYQPYALVSGLYLWKTLGQKFITGNRDMYIYAASDPCRPKIKEYMYIVRGGDFFNGHHYYAAQPTQGGYLAHFGDRIPEVACYPGFEKKYRAQQNVDWVYAEEFTPETFLFDSTLINPMLRTLDLGIEDILRTFARELRDLNKKYGPDNLEIGTRFWFWNLTASRTLTRLVDAGVLAPSGNGQYRFMEKGE